MTHEKTTSTNTMREKEFVSRNQDTIKSYIAENLGLQVADLKDSDKVKKKYRELARQNHDDKHGDTIEFIKASSAKAMYENLDRKRYWKIAIEFWSGGTDPYFKEFLENKRQIKVKEKPKTKTTPKTRNRNQDEYSDYFNWTWNEQDNKTDTSNNTKHKTPDDYKNEFINNQKKRILFYFILLVTLLMVSKTICSAPPAMFVATEKKEENELKEQIKKIYEHVEENRKNETLSKSANFLNWMWSYQYWYIMKWWYHVEKRDNMILGRVFIIWNESQHKMIYYCVDTDNISTELIPSDYKPITKLNIKL